MRRLCRCHVTLPRRHPPPHTHTLTLVTVPRTEN